MENIVTTPEAVQVINALAEKFGLVIDWTTENVLPSILALMEKYISYTMAVAIIGCFKGLLILALCLLALFLTIKSFKKVLREGHYLDEDFWDITFTISALATVILFLWELTLLVVIWKLF